MEMPHSNYNMIVNMLSGDEGKQVQTGISTINTMLGIDLEKDIIDNLDSNINFAVYDGAGINVTNWNIIFTINVKDTAKAYDAFDKIISNLPPQQKGKVTKEKVEGVDSYKINLGGMNDMFIGVKNKNLIITVGKFMYEKALKADVSSGLLSKLEDKNLANTLKADTNVFYLEVNEIFKAVKNFEMFIMNFSPDKKGIDEKTASTVQMFNYFIASSYLDGNSIMGDLVVKTKFQKPFLIGVKELVDKHK